MRLLEITKLTVLSGKDKEYGTMNQKTFTQSPPPISDVALVVGVLYPTGNAIP